MIENEQCRPKTVINQTGRQAVCRKEIKVERGPYFLSVDAFRTRKIYSEMTCGAVE